MATHLSAASELGMSCPSLRSARHQRMDVWLHLKDRRCTETDFQQNTQKVFLSSSFFLFSYLETRTLPLLLEIDGQISCLSTIIFIVWHLKFYTMSQQAQSLLRLFIN